MKYYNNIKKQIILKIPGVKIDIPTLAFVLLLPLPSINYYLGLFNLSIVTYVLRFINIMLVGLILINAFLNHRFGRYVVLFSLVLGVIFIEYIRFPTNRPALIEVAPSMLMQVYFFVVGHEICNTDKIADYLEKVCFCILFIAVVTTVFVPESREDRIVVSNTFFLCALTFFFRKRRGGVILGAISMGFIFLYGRRMHLIYFLIVLCVFYLKKWSRESLKKGLAGMSIATIIVTAIALAYRHILNAIYPLLVSLGISSRSIEMMLGNEFFDLNGRDLLYEIAISLIKESPFYGNGIGSTMVAAKKLMRSRGSYVGSNTHNGILEMGAEFGVVAMIVFIIVHLLVLVRIIKMDISESEELLLLILFATGFLAVLIGGSYLTVTQYALFWGFYISLNMRSKSQKSSIRDLKHQLGRNLKHDEKQ